jgi:ribosomal protein S27E
MKIVQVIRCPNCGSKAERHHLLSSQLTQIECPICDYLMVTCDRTGGVIEAYAPGIYPAAIRGKK